MLLGGSRGTVNIAHHRFGVMFYSVNIAVNVTHLVKSFVSYDHSSSIHSRLFSSPRQLATLSILALHDYLIMSFKDLGHRTCVTYFRGDDGATFKIVSGLAVTTVCTFQLIYSYCSMLIIRLLRKAP